MDRFDLPPFHFPHVHMNFIADEVQNRIISVTCEDTRPDDHFDPEVLDGEIVEN